MTYYMTILTPAVMILIWAVVERKNRFQEIQTPLIVLAVLYGLGCASVASAYARAYGSYLFTILILACTVGWVARRLQQPKTEIQK